MRCGKFMDDYTRFMLDKGNVTGTSDKLPVTAQLDLIRKLQPEAKTIGIIYKLPCFFGTQLSFCFVFQIAKNIHTV